MNYKIDTWGKFVIVNILTGVFVLSPIMIHAATSSQSDSGGNASGLELSGWIPYWQASTGASDAKRHLDEITIIQPFGFVVKENGKLNDLMNIKKSPWTSMLKSARKENVLIIPTVMWSDGANIHKILSDQKLRAKHIKEIVSMVKKGKYDGVDIDYEAKKAETINYFSAFLTELNTALEQLDDDKILSCTIEARTPPESLYTKIPDPLLYANDYAVIGNVCDRVQIMAYDQRNADIKLNAAKKHPYMPVSDVDWVRKVVEFTLQTIPNEKLVLGIPTYGHEYILSVNSSGKYTYERVRALNPDTVKDLLKKYKVKAVRNNAGEISFTYSHEHSKQLHYVTWSDAGAVEQKVDLAKEFDLLGVALFKIDGLADKNIWKLF